MAGKKYSAGAIFLQVVPVFANVQRAIEDEAKNIDRALGDQMERSGEKAGERAGEAASKSMKDSIAKAKIGDDLERQFRESTKGIEKALGDIDTSKMGDRVKREVRAMRAELDSLSKIDLNLDDNFAASQARLAGLRSHLKEMEKGTNLRLDMGGLTKVYRSLAQVEAAIQAVDTNLTLDVDTKGVDRKMGAFERNFKKTTKRAAESLSTSVNKEVQKLGDELKYLENLRIGVDISANRARAELKEIQADVDRLSRDELEIDAKVDLLAAMAELTAFETALRKIDGEDVTVDVKVNKAGLDGIARSGEDAANSFRSFNIVLLAATSAGPALVPILGAIAGGLLALGPAAAVGAFGLGSVLVGFSGIGNALSALQSQQDAAATNAQTNAGRHEAAADQIRAAQESLADAERAAGRAAEDAAERVADARRNAARAAEDAAERVADARRSAADAAEDAAERVADAREEAAEAIEDALERQKDAQEEYRDAVDDVRQAEQDLRDAREAARKDAESLAARQRKNAVEERQAVLDLFEAQSEYNAVMADGSSTNTDKEQASINLEQAQIALNETRTEQVALTEEAADYAKNGVEGSEQVQDAQDSLTAALEAQKEAQEAVKEAAQDADEARVEGAEKVSEALEAQREVIADNARAIRDALEDQAETQADNARAVRQALEDQAESQSDHARSVERAREALARARDSQDELNTSINSQQQAVDNAMNALGPAGRKFALFIWGLRDEWKAFRDDLQTAMLPSIQTALEGFFASSNASKSRDAMIGLAASFGDFVKALSVSFQGPAWAGFFEMLAETGPKIAAAFGGAFISMLEAFASILTTLAPYSLQFGEGLAAMMDGFANWAASEAGQQALMDFMEYAKEVGPAVLQAFVSLALALTNLLVAMAPYSAGILEILTNFFDLLAGIATGPLGAFLGGLFAIITASQIAYGVMNLLLAGTALLGSAIGAAVFAFVGLALAIYYVYRENETLGTILGVIAGLVVGVVVALKLWHLWTKLVAAVQLGVAIATGASTAAITAQSTATKIAAGVTKAWIAVQAALNAVMSLNPFALIVIAIIALVAVLVYAWKNHEGFRNFILDMWEKIKVGFGIAWEYLKIGMTAIGDAAMWLWENAFKPAFSFIWGIVKQVFKDIVNVWNTILWPVIKTIAKIVFELWKVHFKVVFTLIAAAWKGLLLGMKLLWENVLKPLWDIIKGAAKALWENVLGPAFGGIKKAWDAMARGLKKAWDDYGQPIFDWIVKHALPPLQVAFDETIKAIGGMWEGLKKMVGTPIKFVIEKVINEGIIDSFNKIADWVGKDGFDHVKTPEWMANYATGGILPGYTPGRDPHVFHSPTAGTLALSGGEAIMRPEFTRAVGSGFVNEMNALAANGGVSAVKRALGYATGGIYQAFAKGGIVFPVPGGYVNRTPYNLGHDGMDINHPNDASGNVPYVSATSGRVTTVGYSRGYGNAVFVASPYGELVYGHSYDGSIRVGPGDPVSPGQWLANIGNTGNSSGAHLHFGFPGGSFYGAEALLSGAAHIKADDMGGAEKKRRSIPSWLMSVVKDPLGAFKGWITNPLKDAGEAMAKSELFQTVTKVPALLGKKVVDKVWDIVPGWVKTAAGWAGGAADWVVGGVSKAADKVGDIAGDVAGGVGDAAGAVGDALGFARGGILPYNGTMMYDAGGYLPPGMTTVMNLTGKPEPVFTAEQFEGMEIGGGDGFTYAPTINGSDLTAADLVDDMDFARRRIQRQGKYARSMP